MRQAEHCVVRAGLKTARLLSRMIQLQLRPEFAEQFGGMNQLKRNGITRSTTARGCNSNQNQLINFSYATSLF